MYNVEMFISECLDSILNQEINDRIEIIIINDGSPDRSGEIALNYANSDNRVKFISQSNKGLSVARNRGLDEAEGEYVWFIDSDDWVSSESINIICEEIRTYHPEAIHICGADIIEEVPVKLFSLSEHSNKSNVGVDFLFGGYFHGVVQYTIYRKNFLDDNNLRFMPGIYHEDTEFSPRAYYYLKDVRCIDQVLYLKRVNEDSITRTINPKKNLDLIKVSISLQRFADKINSRKNKALYMTLSANALKMAMQNELANMDKATIKKIDRYIYENKIVLRSFLKSNRIIYKVQGFFLKLFSKRTASVNKQIFLNPLLKFILNK